MQLGRTVGVAVCFVRPWVPSLLVPLQLFANGDSVSLRYPYNAEMKAAAKAIRAHSNFRRRVVSRALGRL